MLVFCSWFALVSDSEAEAQHLHREALAVAVVKVKNNIFKVNCVLTFIVLLLHLCLSGNFERRVGESKNALHCNTQLQNE